MIVLAAGSGSRLRPHTDDRPKCLVEVGGESLLGWQRRAARAAGLDDPLIVGGYRADALAGLGLTVIANDDYEHTNMAASLMCADRVFGNGFLASYGDIAYSPEVLRRVLEAPGEVTVAIDRRWRAYWERRFDDPLDDAESCVVEPDGRIVEIGQAVDDVDRIEGQFVGLVRFREGGIAALRAAAAALDLSRLYMTDLLQALIERGVRVDAAPIDGGWIELDHPSDLDLAEDLVREGRLL